jgi:hypothetical protein
MTSLRQLTTPFLFSGLPLVLLACAPVQAQTQLFSENFDDGAAATRWSVRGAAGDFTADFDFDYSSRGIPPAPNADGTTTGLRLMVNNTDGVGAPDAVSVFPLDLTLTTHRTVRFDLWLNYNGGPGGGSGSTEFATFGLFHSGTEVCWANNPSSDGHWFAVSGEGGDSRDYRVYRGASLLGLSTGGYAAASQNHLDPFYQTLFPSPPFETAGAPGKQWVEVTISAHNGVVEWRIDGMLVAVRLEPDLNIGTLMLGCMDTYASIANPVADNFTLFDNVRVEGPDCDDDGLPDDDALAGGLVDDCNANARPDACDAIVLADFDADGDRDAVELNALGIAMTGPFGVLDPACGPAVLSAFDFVADQHIDLSDYAGLQRIPTPGPFALRAADALTGRQFMAAVAPLSLAEREDRILAEITGGNVPGFLRMFVPINVAMTIGGQPVTATYFVAPDYLSIGLDHDFARVPMTPLVAQPIADALDCVLPTRKMVDQIYAQAVVKLAPAPISPSTVNITQVTTHLRHHEMVEEQRGDNPPGPLIGGIKKDVVITPRLTTNPGKVAIYGWHRLSGNPIQPLYTGHVDWYVDYSHGIRLVQNAMLLDGQPTTVAAVLADPSLHVLLSDEGVILDPSY